MATDFVHTSQIVDGVIAVLKGHGATHDGGLPATWFDRSVAGSLAAIMAGDLADYVDQKTFLSDLPVVFVRGLGCRPVGSAKAGGKLQTEERVRVIHARRFDQCYQDDGDRESNMTRARLRYAKIIGKALFNDPNKRLGVISSTGARTEVSLTCADTDGAHIVEATFEGWDYGLDGTTGGTPEVRLLRQLPLQAWAIACDLRVLIWSG